MNPLDGMSTPTRRPGGKRVLVCYVSGLDLRRVSARATPFIAASLTEYPWKRYTNLPSNELFPTLVTGVDPTVHGVWGVRYHGGAQHAVPPGPARHLPPAVATTIQCFRHFKDNTYDLAAIEPRRRASFDITRTKYKRRNKHPEALFEIGGVPTVLGLVGSGQGQYAYSSAADPITDVLPIVCEEDLTVEILELYSLDRFQQWNLHDLDAVESFYGRIDEFLRALNDKCAERGAVLLLLSDHGHEPVVGSFDLKEGLEELGVTSDDLTYFIEVSNARFWFHSPAAAEKVTHWLRGLPNGRLLDYREMDQFGVPLTDGTYGEAFFFLDAGHVFFPHDFYHPLANAFLGLSDPNQRSRLRDPRHKGNHGHLPHFEAETSFMLLIDPDYSADGEPADILDVAPTILEIAGFDRAEGMSGRAVFRPAK